MEIFKQAVMTGLRVPSPKGLLTLEQLCSLPIEELDTLAVSLEDQLEKSGTRSFIKRRSPRDAKLKLAFDITVDILETKAIAELEAQQKLEDDKHNKKIMDLIETKVDQQQGELSIEELKAKLR